MNQKKKINDLCSVKQQKHDAKKASAKKKRNERPIICISEND
jgi:hypothetical protein